MDNKLDKMYEEFLKNDCICIGSFSSCRELMNYLYDSMGITDEDIVNQYVSIYCEHDKYYIPNIDCKKLIDTVGV